MTTRLWLLALGIAWSLNAIFLYVLAEAHWGSILYRLFATILLGLALLAFTFAFGTAIWRTLERVALRAADRDLCAPLLTTPPDLLTTTFIASPPALR